MAGLWKNGSSEFTSSARSDGLRHRQDTNRTETDTESRGRMITLNPSDNINGVTKEGEGVVCVGGGVC